jgi:3-oxoacyl-[acyl-carrier-protein] synthase II
MHGTATPAGDIAESNAIKTTWRKSIYDQYIIHKKQTGHLLGAAAQ